MSNDIISKTCPVNEKNDLRRTILRRQQNSHILIWKLNVKEKFAIQAQ